MTTFRHLWEDHDPWPMTHEYLTHHGYEHEDLRAPDPHWGELHRYLHPTNDLEQSMRHAEACGWRTSASSINGANYRHGGKVGPKDALLSVGYNPYTAGEREGTVINVMRPKP